MESLESQGRELSGSALRDDWDVVVKVGGTKAPPRARREGPRAKREDAHTRLHPRASHRADVRKQVPSIARAAQKQEPAAG